MKVLKLEAAKELYGKLEGNSIAFGKDVFLSREAREFFDAKGVTVKTESGMENKIRKPDKKKEYETSLSGKKMVMKNHPRIKLRGKLDSFQAEILKLQVMAAKEGETALVCELDEILAFSRSILAAEVLDKPLEEIKLFGMDENELRRVSQNPKKHFGVGHVMPTYDMGQICVELNALRALSREVELLAVDAFCTKLRAEREDILMALNRLSSAIYIVFLKHLGRTQKRG